jgi:hypothetical protein
MNAWLKDIDRATTEAEIVAHARDYCSLVHPRDLEPLPETCRTIRIEKDADITRVHETLAKGYEEVRTHASEVEKLRDLLTYLSKANDRLTQLRRPR